MAAQDGFTLFEVLVATVILVIGVLGAAGMTVTALRNSHQSGLRSTAVALAYEIGDAMRTYRDRASVMAIVPNSGTALNRGAVSSACYDPANGCAFLAMANDEIAEWVSRVTDSRNLPGGGAAICRDSSNAAGTPAAPNCDGRATSPMVVKFWWTETNGDGTIVPSDRPNLTVPLPSL